MRSRTFLLGLLFPVFLYSQTFRSTSFGLKDGLPESNITRMMQSSDGYLWLLGNSTLTRYDGSTFEHFSFPVALNPTDLVDKGNGKIEFCENDRLYMLDNGKVSIRYIDTSVTHGKPSEVEMFYFSIFDRFGNRWFFQKGLCCLNDSGTFRAGHENGFPGDSLVFRYENNKRMQGVLVRDNTGRCWLQLKNGFVYFDGVKWIKVVAGGFAGKLKTVFADREGRFWLSNEENEVYETGSGKSAGDIDLDSIYRKRNHGHISICDDGKGGLLFMNSGLFAALHADGKVETRQYDYDFYEVRVDSSLQVVLIGSMGISAVVSGVVREVKRFDRSFNPVIIIDRENNYWFYINNLLERFSPSLLDFTAYSEMSFPDYKMLDFANRGMAPMKVMADDKHRLYLRDVVFDDNGVGFKGCDLFEVKDDTVRYVSSADLGFYNSMSEDKDGDLFVMTYFVKERRYDIMEMPRNSDGSFGKPKAILNNPEIDYSKTIVLENKRGNICFYSAKKIFRNNDLLCDISSGGKDSIFCLHSGQDGVFYFVRNDSVMCYSLAADKVRFLATGGYQLSATTPCEIDAKGNIWFFNRDKVYRVSGNKVVDGGINPKGVLWQTSYRDISRDSSGDIWIATSENGLIRISYDRNGKMILSGIGHDDGLADYTIESIVFDSLGFLWVQGPTGIQRIDYKGFFAGRKDVFTDYGYNEGIRNNSLDGFFMGDDHQIYSCAPDGILSISPAFKIQDGPLPIVHIRSLTWSDGDSVRTDLTIPYDFNPLEIKFIGVCLRDGSKVRYRYFLEGLDTKWQEQTGNSVRYSSLPEGKYTFKLLACHNDGVWTTVPESISFEVLPPWYRTWWFITSSAIFGIFVIWFNIRRRTKRLRAENEKLERTVNERTAEVVAQKEIIEFKNHEITDSINYAKRIQSAILPPMSDFGKYLDRSFVLYMPKDIVSGDFYWIAEKNGLVCVAAADCTGHGVPGAMVSVVCANALNRAFNEFGLTDPGKILDKARELVIETFEKAEGEVKDGMDISICTINRKTQDLKWAGANNPLWYFSGVQFTELRGDKQPVGKHVNASPFNTHTIQLSKGDAVYIFTDGYADQFGGPKGKKFKYKQLQRVIAENRNLSFTEQEEKLRSVIDSWKGDLEQVDDILVIGIGF